MPSRPRSGQIVAKAHPHAHGRVSRLGVERVAGPNALNLAGNDAQRVCARSCLRAIAEAALPDVANADRGEVPRQWLVIGETPSASRIRPERN